MGQVPQEPGIYRDVSGDYWLRREDGWRWVGRLLPWTGRVTPVHEDHGPLPDWVLAAPVDSPADRVLPLTRVEVDDLPPYLL